MKLLIQTAFCVLLVAQQAALCETVSVEPVRQIPLESGRTLRIAVVFDGRPASGVKLEFHPYVAGELSDKATVTLTCDQYGWIETPELPEARYDVVAGAPGSLGAHLLLDVSSRFGTMAFKMELHLVPVPPVPEWETQLANADSLPITYHLREFSGTVMDQSGAVVPKTNIEIVRRGSAGKDVIATFKSGAAGEFSAELRPGTYVALFRAQGFACQVIPFDITNEGSGKLMLVLHIASSSEYTTL